MITRWFSNQPRSFYMLGPLAWSLSTFSVSLLSLRCMTSILAKPSIRSLSPLFQVCWLTRSRIFWSRSSTWLHNLTLTSFLPDSDWRLYSRSQAFPVSHTSICASTGGCWVLVSPGEGDRRSLTSLLSSSRPSRTSCSTFTRSSASSSSFLSNCNFSGCYWW